MDGLTIIDRILGRCAPELQPWDQVNLEFTRDSIRENLEDILNTHRGTVRHLDDYGLPDLNEFTLGSSQGNLQLAREIEDIIRKYEPRFHDVSVKLTKVDPVRKRLELHIVGTVGIQAKRRNFLFQSVVEDPHGARVKAVDES